MSIQPITPLTVDPLGPVDDDWFDDEDVANKIARAIEQRGLTVVNARRGYSHDPLLDHEVDEMVLAVFRSCASIARSFSKCRLQTAQSVGRVSA